MQGSHFLVGILLFLIRKGDLHACDQIPPSFSDGPCALLEQVCPGCIGRPLWPECRHHCPVPYLSRERIWRTLVPGSQGLGWFREANHRESDSAL